MIFWSLKPALRAFRGSGSLSFAHLKDEGLETSAEGPPRILRLRSRPGTNPRNPSGAKINDSERHCGKISLISYSLLGVKTVLGGTSRPAFQCYGLRIWIAAVSSDTALVATDKFAVDSTSVQSLSPTPHKMKPQAIWSTSRPISPRIFGTTTGNLYQFRLKIQKKKIGDRQIETSKGRMPRDKGRGKERDWLRE